MCPPSAVEQLGLTENCKCCYEWGWRRRGFNGYLGQQYDVIGEQVDMQFQIGGNCDQIPPVKKDTVCQKALSLSSLFHPHMSYLCYLLAQ